MKLSTKGRYGLRALIDLALYGEKEAVSIQSISARQMISDSYLEQLVRKLKKAGLVTSVRGAQGGNRLALEGSIEAVSCGDENNANCLGQDLCVARYVWEKVNKSIQETVDSIMISQLVEESRRIQEKTGSDM